MYTKCKFSWHNRADVSDSTKVGCKAASRYTATVQSSRSSLNEVWDFQQSFGKAPARPELSCQASITNWTLATYHPRPHRSPLAPGQVMHHLEDLYSHLQISQWPGYSVSARPPSPKHTTSVPHTNLHSFEDGAFSVAAPTLSPICALQCLFTGGVAESPAMSSPQISPLQPLTFFYLLTFFVKHAWVSRKVLYKSKLLLHVAQQKLRKLMHGCAEGYQLSIKIG